MDRRCRSSRLRRAVRERGATLVEYSLIVALFVVPSIAIIDKVTDSLGNKASDVEAGVAVREPLLPNPAATTSIPPATTTTLPPTTTTLPPTTTTTLPPTTTTTIPPTTTTTTAPTTTTTAKATTGGSTVAGSARNLDVNYWEASGTFTVVNNLGQPVSGAVVTVRARTCNGATCGAWITGNNLPPTNASGVASQATTLPRNGVTRIDIEITGITFPAGSGLTWNGANSPVSVNRPA